jgi:hypothetical protein
MNLALQTAYVHGGGGEGIAENHKKHIIAVLLENEPGALCASWACFQPEVVASEPDRHADQTPVFRG